MKKFALIVAGGTGSRMNTAVPKQFLELAGRPVLMRAMEQFAAYDPQISLVVVLAPESRDTWMDLCVKYGFTLKHELVDGGASRFRSVRNGLAILPEEGMVFIHDGVRPLVSVQTIGNCAVTAIEKGNAIPVMPVTESLRRLNQQGSEHVDRNRYFFVQTPQTFLLKIIKHAYSQPESELFTDDASVCEAMSISINLVEGNSENIKITRPIDFQVAENMILKGMY
ncbi:MAG: 2-C-methyl-D-erythritol 4-phosphate cytidylyltransferase [Prolixibacteraceae bacterium]